MPMIELTAPAGALAPGAADELLDELAACLLRWEKAPDTEFFREITWTYLHEVDPNQLRVNRRPAAAPRFRVEVTVPEGAFSQRRKDGLIGEVHELVADAAGLTGEQGLHVWTLIRDVPDGNWGAAGATVHYEQLTQLAAAERTGTAT